MYDLLFIIIGCVPLYFGAEWLVIGATRLSEGFKIPKAVAGLTLVALGTSAPELFVNLLSASRGHTGFALSNISGSNLANLCLGFGICSLIGQVAIPLKTFRGDLVLFVLTPVVVVASLYATDAYTLHFGVTIILSILLVVYFTYIFRRARDEYLDGDSHDFSGAIVPLIQLIGGSVLLYIGAEVVLRYSISFSENLGISETVIGLTVVAAGTSVPDITASIIATRRGENDIAVGNILGSNISNIVFVLNGTLLVSGDGLTTDGLGASDFIAVAALSFLFAICVLWQQRVSAYLGGGLIMLYAGFLVWRLIQVA